MGKLASNNVECQYLCCCSGLICAHQSSSVVAYYRTEAVTDRPEGKCWNIPSRWMKVQSAVIFFIIILNVSWRNGMQKLVSRQPWVSHSYKNTKWCALYIFYNQFSMAVLAHERVYWLGIGNIDTLTARSCKSLSDIKVGRISINMEGQSCNENWFECISSMATIKLFIQQKHTGIKAGMKTYINAHLKRTVWESRIVQGQNHHWKPHFTTDNHHMFLILWEFDCLTLNPDTIQRIWGPNSDPKFQLSTINLSTQSVYSDQRYLGYCFSMLYKSQQTAKQ